MKCAQLCTYTSRIEGIEEGGCIASSVMRVNMKLIVWDFDVNYAVTSLDVAIPAQDRRLQNCVAYVRSVLFWYAYKNSQT
jgi:hypothetical protein